MKLDGPKIITKYRMKRVTFKADLQAFGTYQLDQGHDTQQDKYTAKRQEVRTVIILTCTAGKLHLQLHVRNRFKKVRLTNKPYHFRNKQIALNIQSHISIPVKHGPNNLTLLRCYKVIKYKHFLDIPHTC